MAFSKEYMPMKIDFKIIVLFGSVASFGFLSAQEEIVTDNRAEVSMSNLSTDDDYECMRKGGWKKDECQRDRDDYDYDVYIVGPDQCSQQKCKQSKRKGAAKVAQE